MIVIVGFIVVIASVCLGYLMEGGIFAVLLQPAELVIIFGAAIGAMADAPDANASLGALGATYPPPDGWTRTGEVPFSSARKWSAASFDGHGSWFLGAPDVLLGPDDPLRDRVAELARMLAGLGDTDSGRAHARELLEAAQQEHAAP